MRSLALWALVAATACGAPSNARAEQVVWNFDNTHCIGGFPVQVGGAPALIDGPEGRALQFDGVKDSVLIYGRPLVGAAQFTMEVVFRPEGGKFEQRFMHIAETNPITGEDVHLEGGGDRNPRFMFEVRVTDQGWYLDTFVNSRGGSAPLIFPDKIHELGRWYAAAQTFDGTTYRAYVNGVLQGERTIAFQPHGPGRVRLGARMNSVDFFQGSIAKARFTDHALLPEEMLTIPE
jgi:hypothetical protein